jgi:hypothetical protein
LSNSWNQPELDPRPVGLQTGDRARVLVRHTVVGLNVPEMTADVSILILARVELEVVPECDIELVRQRNRPVNSGADRDGAPSCRGGERDRCRDDHDETERDEQMATMHEVLPMLTERGTPLASSFGGERRCVLHVSRAF